MDTPCQAETGCGRYQGEVCHLGRDQTAGGSDQSVGGKGRGGEDGEYLIIGRPPVRVAPALPDIQGTSRAPGQKTGRAHHDGTGLVLKLEVGTCSGTTLAGFSCRSKGPGGLGQSLGALLILLGGDRGQLARRLLVQDHGPPGAAPLLNGLVHLLNHHPVQGGA